MPPLPDTMGKIEARAGLWLVASLTTLLTALALTSCAEAGRPSSGHGGQRVSDAALSSCRVPVAGRAWTNSLGMPFVPLPGRLLLCGVWETRVRDFAAFVQATGHDTGQAMFIAESNRWELRPGFHWRNPGFPQGPDHPVVGVNWHDAQAFCHWLTETERAAGLLTASQRYRLPTDLEWSLAVGLTNEPGETPQQRFVRVTGVYPWGTNAAPPVLVGNLGPVFNVDSFERTAPVGTFPPNALGLHDLVGNVIEWCNDAWDTPPHYKVLRGSGWHTDCASCLLSSYRYPNLPDLRIDYYGFRVVLDLAATQR